MAKAIFEIHGKYDEQLEKVKDYSKFKITKADVKIELYNLDDDLNYPIQEWVSVGSINKEYNILKGRDTYHFDFLSEMQSLYSSSGITNLKGVYTTAGRFHPQIYYQFIFEAKEEPSISNIKIENDIIQRDIKVTWTANTQEKYTITVKNKNRVLYTNTQTTKDNFCLIPANTLKEAGETTISITVISGIGFTVEGSATNSNTFELRTLEPYISEFSYENLKLHFKGTNLKGSNGHIKLINTDINNTVLIDRNLSQEEIAKNLVILPPDKFFNGSHKVILYFKNEYGALNKEINFKIKDKPFIEIYALEPSDTSRNYTKNIKISWSSYRQENFILKLKNSEKEIQFQGGKETSYLLPADTFSIEEDVTLTLIIANRTFDKLFQTEKTVKFKLYGGVKPPIISTDVINKIVDKNYFKIKWNKTNKQSYYRVEFDIYRTENIYTIDTDVCLDLEYAFDSPYSLIHEDSGIVRGADVTEYTSKNILLSGDDIRDIKVTIYNILKESNSDVYKDNFNVIYDVKEIENIDFEVDADDDNGRLIVTGNTDAEGIKIDLYRNSKPIQENLSSSFMYIDNRVRSNETYAYYLVLTKDNKSYRTDTKENKIIIDSILFSDDDKIVLELNLEPEYQDQDQDGKVYVKYLGKTAPSLEQDETDYKIATYSCLLNIQDRQTLRKLRDAEEVIYRDHKGRGFVCNISNISESDVNSLAEYVRITFKMVQVDTDKDFD